MPDEEKTELNIKENLIRLSIGVENYEDLIWDIGRALEYVKVEEAEMV